MLALYLTLQGLPLATGEKAVVTPRTEPPKDYWFEEMWYQGGRDVFIEIVRHFVFFWMLVGSIFLFSYALKKSALSAGQREALDGTHFVFYLVALAIFFVTFIIKITVMEFKGITR